MPVTNTEKPPYRLTMMELAVQGLLCSPDGKSAEAKSSATTGLDELTVLCEPLQRTHLQRPLLKITPTAGDETSRGRNPANGRHQDFGRRGH